MGFENLLPLEKYIVDTWCSWWEKSDLTQNDLSNYSIYGIPKDLYQILLNELNPLYQEFTVEESSNNTTDMNGFCEHYKDILYMNLVMVL